MKKFKQILAIAMITMMTVGFMPFISGVNRVVNADGNVAEINGTGYPTVQAAIDAAKTGQTVKMIANSTENVTVANDDDITLDLNGYLIKGSGESSIITNNGTLTIKDSNEGDQTHYFTVGSYGLWNWNDDNSEGAINLVDLTNIPNSDTIIAVSGGCITGSEYLEGAIDNKGELTLSAGNIIGNNGSNASGVQNRSTGTFDMKGGNIIGNISSEAACGVRNYGTLNISNGMIGYNSTTRDEGTPGVYNEKSGIVTMTGGSIINNRAKEGFPNTSGLLNSGKFTMTGGSISGNVAGQLALEGASYSGCGGVANIGTMTLGGEAKIVDNTLSNGGNSNCCVMINVGEDEESYKDYPVCIATGTNSPSDEMKVGVTVLDAQKYSSTKGRFTTNGTASDTKFFTSDNGDYNVAYDSDEKCLELVEKPAVCKIGDEEYPSIGTAIKKSEGNIEAEAETPTVITMIANDEENVIIPINRNIELDLNGFVLKALDTDDNVVALACYLGEYAKLTISDSNTEKAHYFSYKFGAPWEYVGDEEPTDEGVNIAESIDKITKGTTHVMLKGGCITGGNAQGDNNGGGAIFNNGILTVKGTNIVGNTGNLGGGIYCSEKLAFNVTMTLNDVNIVGNVAENGGGVYSDYDTQNLFYGCTIANNHAVTGGGIYKQDDDSDLFVLIDTEITGNYASDNAGGIYYKEASTCVAEGTMIRMADGSEKPIEKIKEGEIVRTFDHESGEVSSASVYLVFKGQDKSHPLKLKFEDGLSVDIVGAHSFLEKETRKYVCISDENVQSYIGKSFYGEDGKWHMLTGAKKESNSCKYYSIFTSKHHNCYANGILNASDVMSLVNPFLNIYELDTSLKADAYQLAEDIKEYGLTDYDELNSKYGISRKLFDNANGKYLNIALGKGVITEEQLEHLCAFASPVDNNKTSKSTSFAPVTALLKSLGIGTATPSLDDYSGNKDILTLGEKVVVKDNYEIDSVSGKLTRSNVYLTDGKMISIDEKIGDVEVGVTLSTGTGQFTANGTENDLKYFFSDSDKYYVKHVADASPSSASLNGASDGHLELAEATIIIDRNIEHGKITVDDQGAGSGKTVKITATPDDGYELDKITIKDKDGNDITAAVLNGTTITVPAEEKLPVTVSASFKKKATPSVNPTPAASDTTKSSKTNGTSTGDNNNLITYFILFDLMLAGIAVVLYVRLLLGNSRHRR